MKTMTEKEVRFTQFLFPNGRKEEVLIVRPAEIAQMAEKLNAEGFVFETENNCGVVWMTCINHEKEIAFDEFCHNGPKVIEKVDSLIKKAFASLPAGKDSDV